MPNQAERFFFHSSSHFLSSTRGSMSPSTLETRRCDQKQLGISLEPQALVAYAKHCNRGSGLRASHLDQGGTWTLQQFLSRTAAAARLYLDLLYLMLYGSSETN